MRELVIAGGGATGLIVAYLAAKAGWRVTLIEAAPQLGGLLATFDTGGDPLEYFYHHFFTHDAEILWLLEELKLSDQLFFKETVMGFFRDGDIFNFTTLFDLLRFSPLSLPDRLRFAATSIVLSKSGRWQRYEDISCLEWFRRWAGSGVTEAIWRPMLEIKFGAYADQVPLAWMIGRLQQRMSSRQGGREKLGYLLGSLRVLVERLHEVLVELGVTIRTGSPITRINVTSGRVSGLILQGEERLPCEDLLVTLPAPLLGSMLGNEWLGYADSLKKIEYFGAICGVVFLRRPLSHVYWLNVADPGFPFGGVIEQTNFVPQQRYGNEHIAYLSRYTEQTNPLLSLPSEQIVDDWLQHLLRMYPGLQRNDINDFKIFRTRSAAVVCNQGFSRSVPRVKTPIEGLWQLNMAHVYPDERSVNNCIRIAANYCTVRGIPHQVPQGRSLSGLVGFD